MDTIAIENRYDQLKELSFSKYSKLIRVDFQTGSANYESFHAYAKSICHKPFEEFDIDNMDLYIRILRKEIDQKMKAEMSK